MRKIQVIKTFSAMWYLVVVNLPGNKLNIAVKTEKNSIAADCLNKVSRKLLQCKDRVLNHGAKSCRVNVRHQKDVAKMSYHNHRA